MEKIQKIYCPVCGKTKKVELYSSHLKIWKCTYCEIHFSFSMKEYSRVNNNSDLLSVIIDPVLVPMDVKNVIDPQRVVRLERIGDYSKITGNIGILDGLKQLDNNKENNNHENISKPEISNFDK